MSNKQIPSIDKIIEDNTGAYSVKLPNYLIDAYRKSAGEFAKEVVKYTLRQAAEKAVNKPTMIKAGNMRGKYTVSVDRESILSLEEQIIKDLGI